MAIVPPPTPIDNEIVESGESDQGGVELVATVTAVGSEGDPEEAATLPPVQKLLLGCR